MKTLPIDAYREIVHRALEEDIGAGDVTTHATVPAAARARGVLLVKADCVLAGVDIAFEAFRQVAEQSGRDVTCTASKVDGDQARAGEEIAEILGPAAVLLTAERTALNFLQRLSGIATRTRQFVDAAASRITVLDTRKTTPTLRGLEKYAVRAGGGTNHRFGLFDAILIKDNHVRLAGGVQAAVRRARDTGPGLTIEVEAQTLREVEEALAAGADTILLDNLPTDAIREAVQRTAGRARTEISGGVTLERMAELARTGADFVSVGALTHSSPAVDISFEIAAL
jgi:nicotinate-nucleotide pyrophosphorylase (carboxylating)